MSENLNPLAKVEQEILRFDQLIEDISGLFAVETLAPRIHIIHPKAARRTHRAPDRDVNLTLMAIIHGVEVAGLAILNELLAALKSGQLPLEVSIGLALGNIAAAQKGVRFVDRDLNRSFGRESLDTIEDRRADDLETLLARSERLIDFHQVRLKIDRPFWIFPYSKNGYKLARSVAPEVSIITHWGKGFSQEGQCSDEWLNHHGGNGVTMELGQNGFDPAQIAMGLGVVKKALAVVTAAHFGRRERPSKNPPAPLYTWGEIVAYPPTGGPVLDEGWHNFKMVTAGGRLGQFNGQEVCASVSGPVLFPKYPDKIPANGVYGDKAPAAELIRILKVIDERDLPADK